MEKMKAFVRTNEHSREVELTDVKLPEIDDSEVLVNVRAFGVGIHDRFFIPDDAHFPYPIGVEAAGVIERLGKNVNNFHIGDGVILSSALQQKGGCWAEYAAVPHYSLTPMPPGISYIEGATIPVAGKTALESMLSLDLSEGDTLFAAGASGAIGTLVNQLAASKHICIAASASRKNHEFMQSLGAELTVDYSNPDWKNQVLTWRPDGVDAALAIQPGTADDCLDIVKDGGKVITVSGDQVESERNITVKQIQHHPETQQTVTQLISDVAAGKIRIVIEHVYPFDQAVAALEKTETRHARGKLVVSLMKESGESVS